MTGPLQLTLALIVACGWGHAQTLRTIAGSDHMGDGGPALLGQLAQPEGLAQATDGTLYVADAADHRVRMVGPNGILRTLLGDGQPGFAGDGGPAVAARLRSPYGLALDRMGRLLVADLGNGRVRRVERDGTVVTLVGGGDQEPAIGLAATEVQLRAPRNLLLGPAGELYVSDFDAHRVYRIVSGRVDAIIGSGLRDRGPDGPVPASALALAFPAGLALDASGALLIADTGNQRIVRVTANQASTLPWSPPLGTGPVTPTSLAVDARGVLYVADGQTLAAYQVNTYGPSVRLPVNGRDLLPLAGSLAVSAERRVVRWAPGVTAAQPLLGTGLYGFAGDGGPATLARFRAPAAVARSADGALYIADTDNCRVRRIDPAGPVRTVLGTGVCGEGGDLGPAIRARVGRVTGLAVDRAGALYVSDTTHHRIRRVDVDGVVTVFAGTGEAGYRGDGQRATTAQLREPSGLAIDADGAVWVADRGNHCVRRMGRDGVIRTVIGTGVAGPSGDEAPAARATLNRPAAVAIDADANVWVADTGNGAVRWLGRDGTLHVHSPAESAGWPMPTGLAHLEGQGLLVADSSRHVVLHVTPAGEVRTVAGTGRGEFSGEEGPAQTISLHAPSSLAPDGEGGLLIADTGNHRVRHLSLVETAAPLLTTRLELRNAVTGQVTELTPGGLFALHGADLGGAERKQAEPGTNGRLPTQLDGLEVIAASQACPLVSLAPDEVVFQLPYELPVNALPMLLLRKDGRTVGQAEARVAPSAPGLLLTNQAAGLVRALQEDGTLNTQATPARLGARVDLFLAGAGPTVPGAQTGRAEPGMAVRTQAPIQVSVGGLEADVVEVRTHDVGVLRLTVQLPVGFVPEGWMELRVRVGTSEAQRGVGLWVR